MFGVCLRLTVVIGNPFVAVFVSFDSIVCVFFFCFVGAKIASDETGTSLKKVRAALRHDQEGMDGSRSKHETPEEGKARQKV